MFPYFSPLFFTREQRKLLTIRNWTLLGLHVQNSSIYTYIMTWVYCQLSLEDYSCHVTSRDMSCDQGKFSCEKKPTKKNEREQNLQQKHKHWHGTLLLSDIMSTRTPKHIPRNTKISLLLNANTVFISKG